MVGGINFGTGGTQTATLDQQNAITNQRLAAEAAAAAAADPNKPATITQVIENPNYRPAHINLVGLTLDSARKYGTDTTSRYITEVVHEYEANNLEVETAGGAIPVVYGQAKVAGRLVEINTSGTHLEYLHMAVVFCEGAIEGFAQDTYPNDLDTGGSSTQYSLLLNGLPINSYRPLTTNTDTATYTQQRATVAGQFDINASLFKDGGDATGFGDPLWTSSHTLDGIAYVKIYLYYVAGEVDKMPDVTAVIKGKKCREIATDTDEYAYSQNPAVILYDYLRNSVYGKGLSRDEIDVDSFTTAETFCDQNITLAGAVTGARYTFNGTVDTAKNIFDNIKMILSSMNAALYLHNGKYKLRIEKAESNSMTFVDDASDGSGVQLLSQVSISNSGVSSRLNSIDLKYRNSFNYYTMDTIHFSDSTYLTEDNNRVQSRSVTMEWITDPYRAQFMARRLLDLSRRTETCSFVAPPEALALEIGDVFTVTDTSVGYSARTFRATSITIRGDFNVQISGVEYNASDYVLAPGDVYVPPGETTLISPFMRPPTLTNVVATDSIEWCYVRETQFYRVVKISFDEITYPYADKIRVTSVFTGESVDLDIVDGTHCFYQGAGAGDSFAVSVQLLNNFGGLSAQSNLTIPTYDPRMEILERFKVSGLELQSQLHQRTDNNWLEFFSKDLAIKWRPASITATDDIGTDLQNYFDEFVRGYLVRNYGMIEWSFVSANYPDIAAKLTSSPSTAYKNGVSISRGTIVAGEFLSVKFPSSFVTQPNFTLGIETNREVYRKVFENHSGNAFRIFQTTVVPQFNFNQSYSNSNRIAGAISEFFHNLPPTAPTGTVVDRMPTNITLQLTIPERMSYLTAYAYQSDTQSNLTGMTTADSTYLNSSTTDDYIGVSGLLPGGTTYVRLGVSDHFEPNTIYLADDTTSYTTPYTTISATTAPTDTSTFVEGTVWTNPNTGEQSVRTNSGWSDPVDNAITTIENDATITKGGITIHGSANFSTYQKTQAYSATAGVFFGYDSTVTDSNKYALGVGDATSYMYWTADDGLVLSGEITATTGAIGGWTIDTNKLIGGNAVLYATGALTLGTSNDVVNLSATDTTYRLWAGNASAASAPFRIGKDGSLTATDATLTGTISASYFYTSGTGKRIEINPSDDNEIHFYGDRGDTTVEELATIGIRSSGSDYVIGYFGSSNSDHIGVLAQSDTNYAIRGVSVSDSGVQGISTSGVALYANSTSGIGCQSFTTSGAAAVWGQSASTVGVVGTTSTGVGVKAWATGTPSTNTTPLLIVPSSSTSAPSHSAAIGSLWVTSAGVLYINTSGSTTWTKVGAQ